MPHQVDSYSIIHKKSCNNRRESLCLCSPQRNHGILRFKSFQLMSIVLTALLTISGLQCAVATMHVSNSTLNILHQIWKNGDGSYWDYTNIEKCIANDNNFFTSIGLSITYPAGGLPWSFQKSIEGNYMANPCGSPVNDKSFIGVECDCTSTTATYCDIVKLTLPCGNLTGNFSAITSLSSLQYLSLSNNKFPLSSIPIEVSHLKQLKVLDISNNNFAGGIGDTISQLTNLQVLHLSNSGLTGSVPNFSSLTKLQAIFLDGNALSGSIHNSISQLINLQYLYLDDNQLSGAIPTLSLLTNLRKVVLNDNQLSGAIPELSQLANLQTLDLNNNLLTGRIPQLSQLKQLKNLAVSNNSLSGALPDVSQLTNLVVLSLNQNFLTGSLPDFSQLTNLNSVDFGNNKFSGNIPNSISSLTNARFLYLTNNAFQGAVPDGIAQMTSLEYLYLDHNALSGNLPGGLKQLTKLRSLHLENNAFSGELPAGLSGLTSLYEFACGDNQLSGMLPADLGQLTNLVKADFSHNNFSGTLPATMSKLSSLKELFIQNNRFTLDTSGGASTNSGFDFLSGGSLELLIMSHNNFSGQIPDSLFSTQLQKIQVLSIGSNCFQGTIPSSICTLQNLKAISISGLSGGAFCRNEFWKDTIFRNAFNGFKSKLNMLGTLPQCLFQMSSLQDLYAGGNRLLGALPATISPSLQTISLSFNRLGGPVPVALARHANISYLDLGNNRLQGNLSMFEGVSVFGKDGTPLNLTLNVNYLSGNVPQSLLALPTGSCDILAGNVFQCEESKANIPEHDDGWQGYSCAANKINNRMYFFATIMFVLCVAVGIAVYLRLHAKYAPDLRLWLSATEAQLELAQHAETINIVKFACYQADIRNFILRLFPCSMALMVMYLSMSSTDFRLLEFSYTWGTSAAYLTGTGPTACLMVALFIFSLYWIYHSYDCHYERVQERFKDHVQTSLASFMAKPHVGAVVSGKISDFLIPLARFLCLIALVWIPVIGVNALYLRAIIFSPKFVQEVAGYSLAVFRIVWSTFVTPTLMESDFLLFKRDRDLHDAFINWLFGSAAYFLFLLDTLSLFVLPILTQLVTGEECFNNIFIRQPPLDFAFDHKVCTAYHENEPLCANEVTASSVELIDIPFVYNFTCSGSVLRTFATVFATTELIELVIVIVNFLFLLAQIKHIDSGGHTIDDSMSESVENAIHAAADQNAMHSHVDQNAMHSHVDDPESAAVQPQTQKYAESRLASLIRRCKQYLRWMLEVLMPLPCLMLDTKARGQRYAPGLVFGEKIIFLTSSLVSKQLTAILTVLTIGILVPIITLISVVSIVAQTYVIQLQIGRFLVEEMTAADLHRQKQERKLLRELSWTQHERGMHVSQAAVDQANEPWGSIAAVKHLDEQCIDLPVSLFSLSRSFYVLSSGVGFALSVQDILNGEIGRPHNNIVPPLLSFFEPLVAYAVAQLRRVEFLRRWGSACTSEVCSLHLRLSKCFRTARGENKNVELPKSSLKDTVPEASN